MKGKVDSEDAILAPLFALAAGSAVGIANVSMFDRTLQDTALTLGGTDIAIGSFIAVAVLVVAWITNDADLSNLDDEYYYATIATAVLVVGVPFVPAISDFVTSNDFLALAAVIVQSAGFMAISYLA